MLGFTFYCIIYSVIFHCAPSNTKTPCRARLLTVGVCYHVRCDAVAVVTCAQFEFDLPSTVVEKRIKKFVAKYRSCENVICKFV